MKIVISIALIASLLAACTSAPPPESKPSPKKETPAGDTATSTTRLEDIIAKGDYNNDGPVNQPVPGAASDRDIPEDPFPARVNSRPPE